MIQLDVTFCQPVLRRLGCTWPPTSRPPTPTATTARPRSAVTASTRRSPASATATISLPTGWTPPPRSAGSSSFTGPQPGDRFGVPGTEGAFGLHAASRPGELATPAVHRPFREWGPPSWPLSPAAAPGRLQLAPPPGRLMEFVAGGINQWTAPEGA